MGSERRDRQKWQHLFLLRHGESTCNEVNRFAGKIDAPLTPLGEAQARMAATGWEGPPPEVVFTSPLQRARRTAELLFPLPPEGKERSCRFLVDPRINERHFGDFTLKNKAFIQRRMGLRGYEDALYGESPALQGGESFAQFHRRVLEFLRDTLHPLLLQGKRVVVVAHKYVIELLTRLILRLPDRTGYDLRLPNAKLLPGAQLSSYIRKECQKFNLLQEWIVLHHTFVFLTGAVLGLGVHALGLLPSVPVPVPLALLALTTGFSLARVDLTGLHQVRIAIRPMLIRYLLLPLALALVFVGSEGGVGWYFLALLLAAPSAITSITISRCLGGMVTPTVHALLMSTCLSTLVMIPLLGLYGVTALAGPTARLLAITFICLGLPLLVVRFFRSRFPIGTAKFAERNGATAVLLLTCFIVLSFGTVDLQSFWPAGMWAFAFAVALRLAALAFVRRRSLYAVDDYVSMAYPNIFFVILLTSMLHLGELTALATWFLFPMFFLAPVDEWICRKFLAPLQDDRLLAFLRITPQVKQGEETDGNYSPSPVVSGEAEKDTQSESAAPSGLPVPKSLERIVPMGDMTGKVRHIPPSYRSAEPHIRSEQKKIISPSRGPNGPTSRKGKTGLQCANPVGRLAQPTEQERRNSMKTRRGERREHKRFFAEQGAYVVAAGHLGEILDISRAGLAFRHLNLNGGFPASGRVDLVLETTEFLKNLPIRKVSEHMVDNKFPTSPLEVRRYSVRFGELSDSQALLLERFIEHCTTGGEQEAAAVV